MDWAAKEPTQRVSILMVIPRLLESMGHSPDSVLSPLGLRSNALDDPEQRIPYALVGAILARCRAVTGVPHFGLLVGAEANVRVLGLLGDLMAAAPTLEAALTDFARLMQANSRGGGLYLRRMGDDVVVGYGIYDDAATAREQVLALVAAMTFRIACGLTDGRATAEAVLLSFRQPDDSGPYRSVFECPIFFDQPETGLILSRRTLALPVCRSDGNRYAALKAAAMSLQPHGRREWTDRVRHVLRPLLLRGAADTALIAVELGLTIRSLSRRLEKEGTTAGTLLDEVRYASARELLSLTQLSVGEIGEVLGYAHASTFVTAFRRWSGTTPQRWRDKARPEVF